MLVIFSPLSLFPPNPTPSTTPPISSVPLPFYSHSLFSLFSSFKHVSGRTVWSCHSLRSPDRNLACCYSAGCHCDICIRRGRSLGQRVQVSSLTGSCPYLAQVAPSDRLKVRADLVYIDNSVLFPLFPFLFTQWPVIRKCVLKPNNLQSDFWFSFYFIAEAVSLLKQDELTIWIMYHVSKQKCPICRLICY